MLCLLGPGGQLLGEVVAWFALRAEGGRRPLPLSCRRSPEAPSPPLRPFLFYNRPICRKDINLIIHIDTQLYGYAEV